MANLSELRIGIAGLGLIGGSMALALRSACPGVVLYGTDPDSSVGRQALAVSCIDHLAGGMAELLEVCDLVVLCQPVQALLDSLGATASAPRLPVICDVASVKAPVLEAAARCLGGRRGRFVGAHPIAGKAERGLQAADGGLFRGRAVVLCTEGADSDAVALVHRLWRGVGARSIEMPAAQHDEIYAALSHLPQLLSWAYARTLAGEPWRPQLRSLAGPGFESFTRLVRSDPRLWAEIVLHNRAPVLARIERLHAGLDELRRAVEAGEFARLVRLFDDARGSLGTIPG